MGILDRFEERVNRLVNGTFAKAFEAEVQPVEIASALQNEATDRAVIMGAGRTVVPNIYSIDLAPHDYERLSAHAETLCRELAASLREFIAEQRYTTLGEVRVDLAEDKELIKGVFRVNATARSESGTSEPNTAALRRGPHLIVEGFVFPLTRNTTVIGRGTDADVKVEQPSVSRKHCEITLGQTPMIRDLGSTNGTYIGNQQIESAALTEDTDIRLGNVVIQYRAH